MTQSTFDEIIRLREQLSREEQRALASYLQSRADSEIASADEWESLFMSLIIDVGEWPEDLSLRREDQHR
jgi:hypothetical protein